MTLTLWDVAYGVKANGFLREVFQCRAEDRAHAIEQAKDAYPRCKIYSATTLRGPKIPRTTARRLKAEKQRDAATRALVAIKQDLQNNGEVYKTDEARINRINEGLLKAGFLQHDIDEE